MAPEASNGKLQIQMEGLVKVVNDGREKQMSLERSLNTVKEEQSRMEEKIDRLIFLVQQGALIDQGEVNTSFAGEDRSISLKAFDGNKRVQRTNQLVDSHLADLEGIGLFM